jgi:putative NADH-flavin reductase
MKIAIIGASGQTGAELIREALTRGHEIIGVARTPENIASDDPRIIKRRGDAFDRQSIVDGVEGADVVITSIGKRNLLDKRYTLNTDGHRNVVEGMRQHNVERLIPISSFGAAQGVVRKGIRRKIYLFLRRKYYGDMNRMEQDVLSSGLHVTVVRAPMLHNREATHSYEVVEGNELPQGKSVSRADLAHFILEQLESEQSVNKIVALADAPAG